MINFFPYASNSIIFVDFLNNDPKIQKFIISSLKECFNTDKLKLIDTKSELLQSFGLKSYMTVSDVLRQIEINYKQGIKFYYQLAQKNLNILEDLLSSNSSLCVFTNFFEPFFSTANLIVSMENRIIDKKEIFLLRDDPITKIFDFVNKYSFNKLLEKLKEMFSFEPNNSLKIKFNKNDVKIFGPVISDNKIKGKVFIPIKAIMISPSFSSNDQLSKLILFDKLSNYLNIPYTIIKYKINGNSNKTVISLKLI